jgi:hypothetical protein
MVKIKGRTIKGLAKTAQTWQAFEGKPGFKVAISFNAKTGVFWATPLTHTSYLVFNDNGEMFNLSVLSNPIGYKGKIAYLKRAIADAIEQYEYALSIGKVERKG